MKFVTVNTTSYNKDAIIGVEMPTKDEEGRWFYVVFIKDAIEEIVDFDTAEECIKARTELMTELENNYYEDISIQKHDIFEETGCLDEDSLLEALADLKRDFLLDDTVEGTGDGSGEITIPLIDQIRNRLEDLDGMCKWSERLAKTLIDIEEFILHNQVKVTEDPDGYKQEILNKIQELPLDEYRF